MIAAVLLVFAALAPVLSKPQFARTLENLNVETALEARRDGHWFVPTLEAQPRTKKPPLTAWITASSMRPETVANLSHPDPAVRVLSFQELAWEARWPALLQMCLALIAISVLGRALGVGGEAALLAASTYLFIRYAQVSLTDIPLTLWVITANAMFAVAVFEKRPWAGAIGAGIALGLAFLSKGPVAFVQTVAPWILWALWQRRSWKGAAGPLIAAALAWVLIAVPWYLAVLLRDPQAQWKTWFHEVTGSDASDRGEPIYWYATYLWQFMPALLFAIPGACVAIKAGRRRPQLALMLWLFIVPFVVQSFFKDKKDRYILPLLGPLAVMASVGLREWVVPSRKTAGAIAYWITLAAIPIALATLAAIGWPAVMRGPEGRPWFAWSLSGAAIAATVVILVGAIRGHQWQSERIAMFSLLLMLLTMHLVTRGYYGRSASGMSRMYPLAERIWAQYPTAELYTSQPFGQRASEDLSIYSSRLTGWITDQQIKTAVPGDRAKIVLMREREGVKSTRPAGWQEFMYLPEGREAWRAIVLPPR